ncbi:DUF4164 family protein [Thalassospira marina]|uniref:DUF4164 domain-containing protein n=1 Tax=Thalassospira marina TaxID=2048283 RepID=A0A2N3KSD2_9PROT|nr:hypothetical protein [Thalassospira marina]AUG52462.1 hypothetical protein CSC3H3_06845 [Thalassospira marina]PKR53420.1 hypothetical protein COO20_15135 [Thalassospira marina]
MSRLQNAGERLENALAALEAAVESRLARSEAAIQSGVSENAAAQARSEEMRAQLDALKHDYDVLAEATETVSQRLDGAVGQLRLVLSDETEQKQA